MTAPNPWSEQISVATIHRNTHPGNVRAFVALAIGPLTIHGVKIVQQPGQRAYVRLPDVQSGGKWYPVIECTDEQLKTSISDAVLTAWNGGAA